MDIAYLHERALDDTARLVDGVSAEHMDLPTPCADWDVRALLTHLVGGNIRWAAAAQNGSMAPRTAGAPAEDLLGDDPAGAYRRSAALVALAWQDPALLDRTFELHLGVLPGQAAITLHLVETVIHAWDLGKAIGQYPAFEPEVVDAAMQFTQAHERPPSPAFAPPVPAADDLPAIDRLAAFLGRTPFSRDQRRERDL